MRPWIAVSALFGLFVHIGWILQGDIAENGRVVLMLAWAASRLVDQATVSGSLVPSKRCWVSRTV